MPHPEPVLESAPGARTPHRLLLGSLVVGLVLAAVLVAHGATWWSAPLAVIAVVVLGHVVALLGLFGLVGLVVHGRHGADHDTPGDQLARPRVYDWMVRLLSGGREARVRADWIARADLRPGDAVLDVGCGTGTLLLAVAEHVGPTGMLQGLEPSAPMVARAEDKARARGVDLKITQGSAHALPFADASFDVVFSTLVFHHLPSETQRAALDEICRVLRPGGRVVIVDLPHADAGSEAPRRGGLRSLVEMMHGRVQGRLIDIRAELADRGAREVTEHPAGMRGLRLRRAVFP